MQDIPSCRVELLHTRAGALIFSTTAHSSQNLVCIMVRSSSIDWKSQPHNQRDTQGETGNIRSFHPFSRCLPLRSSNYTPANQIPMELSRHNLGDVRASSMISLQIFRIG